MSHETNIEWCDSTFNPWEGCTKVGPGCDHCYAEARNNRFQGGNWGPGAPRRRTSKAYWQKPVKWNNQPFYQCQACGWRGSDKDRHGTFYHEGRLVCCEAQSLKPTRRRVFCASLADWLDNEVPIEWLADLLYLIRQTPNLDWLLLTKRIGNWEKRMRQAYEHANIEWKNEIFGWARNWKNGIAPFNVWLGATIVNQEEADRDIPKLLQVPARIRFLSMEPLLGQVGLKGHDFSDSGHGQGWIGKHGNAAGSPTIDWVIAGGESGPHARPSHPDWFRSLRDQCQEASAPFLFKQWGEWREAADDELPGRHTDPAMAEFCIVCANGFQGEMTMSSAMLHRPRTRPQCFPHGQEGNANCNALHMRKVGKKRAGRRLDGRTWDQFPETTS